MKRLNCVLLLVIAVMGIALFGYPAATQAAGTTATISPNSVVDVKGITVGPVSRLAAANQTGTKNNASAYLSLTTPSSGYVGQFYMTAPAGFTANTVTALSLKTNFLAPSKKVQTWTWSLYNWKAKGWVNVGNNQASDGVNWSSLTFKVARPTRFVNSSGQILARVKSSNKAADLKLDSLSATVTMQALTSKPAGDVRPVGISGSWRLVFDDEFNGSSLDLNKWQPNWLGPNDQAVTQYINSEEYECYDPANVKVASGEVVLSVKAKKCPSSAGKSAGMPYTSAMVNTANDFTFTYGVAEVRMWVGGPDKNHCNNWDAFWLNGEAISSREEYDVAECLDGSFNFHLNPANVFGGQNTGPISGGWHVFSINWQSSGATVYYDGGQIGTITQKVYKKPMYLILQLGIKKGGKIVVPDTMRIDYARVWQK